MARHNGNHNNGGNNADPTDTGAATPTADPGHPHKDKLSKKQLAANYGWAVRVINKNNEIRDLFQRAVKHQWDQNRFNAELRNTDWFQNNSGYARDAWYAERLGGADWEAQMGSARQAVTAMAVEMGAELTQEELDQYAHDYIYEGWSDAKRAPLMQQALAGYGENRHGNDYESQVDPASGGMTSLIQQLKDVAMKNGMTGLSDDYYSSAARSIVAGLSDAKTWEMDIRTQAASRYPVYKDKIMAGVDVQDLASGYMSLLRDTLELPDGSVDLNNKYIKQALSGVDPEKGTPRAMGMWDFENLLKQDDRWQYTKNAAQEVGKVTQDVLRQFGFGV